MKKSLMLLTIMFVLVTTPMVLYAIEAPHNYNTVPDQFGKTGTPGYYCSICHNTHGILGTTGFNNACTWCHNSTSTKPFNQADASNPYGTVLNGYSGGIQPTKIYQSSHNWAGSDTLDQAGAAAPVDPNMTNFNLTGKLLCVRCHSVHSSYSSASNSRHFVRVLNGSDQMCLDCHRARNHNSQAFGTHPVNVNLATVAAAKPTKYVAAPINANNANSTSALPMFNGTVSCSTCHGVHYSDSKSGSTHSAAAWSKLSTSTGGILRTNAFGSTATAINICTNCHIGANHNPPKNGTPANIQCDDCHSGHVDYIKPADVAAGEGTLNVYMLRRYMNYSGGVKLTGPNAYRRKAFFTSTSALTTALLRPDGKGICQACHTPPLTVPEHGTTNYASQCSLCHGGTGTISGIAHSSTPPAGCTGCHGSPPEHTQPGTIYKGGYAVYSSTNNTALISRSYSLTSGVYKNESTAGHPTHAAGKSTAPYTFACSECHNGNSHKTQSYQDVFIAAGTLSPAATFTPGAVTSTCANMYCHSYGLSTLTKAKSVGWAAGIRGSIVGDAKRCIQCHNGVIPSFNTMSTNSHFRHVSNVGTTGKNIGCVVCHSATVSNNTTIADYTKHVNGSREVVYNGSSINATLATAMTGSTWTSPTCTTYCHSNGGSTGVPIVYTAPNWTDRTTGKCDTCHKTANPIAGVILATNAHFTHISSSYGPKLNNNTLCNTCHIYGTDLDSTHVNGTVDKLASNLCINCHGQATPTWTNSARLSCQSCHSGWGNGSNDTLANVSNSMFDNSGVKASFKPFTTFSHNGHGQSGTTVNGTYPATPYYCTDCHDNTSKHITGVLGDSRRLPAALDTSSAWSTVAGNNALCSTCHTAAGTASNKIRLTHVTNHLDGTGTMACARCHDVHGKSKNDHMVSDGIVFTNQSSPYPITYRYTVGVTPYNFINAQNRGICQICHVKSNHFRRDKPESGAGATGWNGTGSTSHVGFTTSTDCLSCHQHNSGSWAFYPQGNCNSCHGYPPLPKSYVKGVGNYNDGSFEDYSAGGGSHVVAGHVPKGAKWSSGFNLCQSCHAQSDHTTSGVKGPWRTNQTNGVKVTLNGKLRFNPATQPKYSSNRLDGTAHTPGNCSNVSCHFQSTPTKWGNK